MIRIRVTHADDIVSGLEVSGHAGLGEPGTDPLCAGVSVLAENVAASIETLIGAQVEREERSGYMKIRIPDGADDPGIQLLFASALLGFSVLEGQFPERIQMESDEPEVGG